MRILFTGASSFTGYWFVRELARAGHEVVATFRRRPEQYADGLRRKRVAMALEMCRGVFECSFGDAEFLKLAGGETWDLFCHHGAEATDYKSPSFDLVAALESNSRHIEGVLDALGARNGGRPPIVLTGSVFENDEGAGSEGLPAFSPYGLSKSFTYQVFRFHALRAGFTLGKFVIPNPFGPYEDPRFTAYLVKTWLARQTATVNTPAYVRDNIHVSLLARAYARFAEGMTRRSGLSRICPSGYPESQGAFARRFAGEMQPRLGIPCEVELRRQVDFGEPRVRINTDVIDGSAWGWNEAEAWDEVANYYKGAFSAHKDPLAPDHG
jgi:nucleoside-diphosphate-sugar epimerase